VRLLARQLDNMIGQYDQRAWLIYWAMAAALAAAASAARRVSIISANRSGPETQFEESASDELAGLGLNG
jgi:hypothetical protein